MKYIHGGAVARSVVLLVTSQFVISACMSTNGSTSSVDSPRPATSLPTVLTTTALPTEVTTTSLPIKSSRTTVVPPRAVAPSATITTSTTNVTLRTEPSSPDDNSFSAVEVLRQITVENEVSAGYDRSLFRHWISASGNGCDTRQEVLKRDSRSLPQVDPYRCKVIVGDWYSPYDGATWTNPSDVDIDHVVALKEAWDSGAWSWSSDRRRAFANDLSDRRSLMAVTDSINQSKGDRDPSQWLPPKRDYQCTYISIWLSIKARWSLSMDPSEVGKIRVMLDDQCRDLRVAKWSPAPIA